MNQIKATRFCNRCVNNRKRELLPTKANKSWKKLQVQNL